MTLTDFSVDDSLDTSLVEIPKDIVLKDNLVFNEVIVKQKLSEYLSSARDSYKREMVATGRSGEKFELIHNVHIPSEEGFRIYLCITKDLWEKWMKNKKFSYLVDYLNDVRSVAIQSGSLSGKYSSRVSALLLNHLGYRSTDDTPSISVGGNAVIVMPEKKSLDSPTSVLE